MRLIQWMLLYWLQNVNYAKAELSLIRMKLASQTIVKLYRLQLHYNTLPAICIQSNWLFLMMAYIQYKVKSLCLAYWDVNGIHIEFYRHFMFVPVLVNIQYYIWPWISDLSLENIVVWMHDCLEKLKSSFRN